MDTTRAFKLCRKIRREVGSAVSIRQDVWAFWPDSNQLKYQLTYFTDQDGCEIVHFDKWSELETFVKEKWDV